MFVYIHILTIQIFFLDNFDLEFCNNNTDIYINEFGVTKRVASPEYPKSYKINKYCNITLHILADKRFGVHIVNHARNCTVRYTHPEDLWIRECVSTNNKRIHTTDIVSGGNLLAADISMLLPPGEGEGFVLSITGKFTKTFKVSLFYEFR